MKKFKLALIFALVLSFGLSLGAYADGVARQIKAVQNGAIKVQVNGTNLDLSDDTGSLDPIIYNGHSYVPAKALAESLGALVKWDEKTSTVVVTGGTIVDGTLPNQDNSGGNAPEPKPTATPTSESKATPAPDVVKGNHTVYVSSTSQETLIKDFKPLAGKILKAFASALKTGDTSTLKNAVGSLEYKNKAFSVQNAEDVIKKARDKYSQVILDKMATQINFAIDSDYLDTSNTVSYASSLDVKFTADFSSDISLIGKSITFSFRKDFDTMSLILDTIYM
jgi:hypothetical protein